MNHPSQLHSQCSRHPVERLFLAGLLIVGLAGGCSSLEPTRISRDDPWTQDVPARFAARGADSLVAIGDSITVSAWGYPEFNSRGVVKQTGTISLPLIGEQLAAGLRRGDLTNRIEQRLRQFIKGEFKLYVEVFPPPARITVLGSIGRPGSFPSPINLSLMEVIATAGGWTDQSDLGAIYISRMAETSRGEEMVIQVDLLEALDNGDLAALPIVRPGDIVIVPRKEDIIRESAELMGSAFLLFGFFQVFR